MPCFSVLLGSCSLDVRSTVLRSPSPRFTVTGGLPECPVAISQKICNAGNLSYLFPSRSKQSLFLLRKE
jgi:hypothetical protein